MVTTQIACDQIIPCRPSISRLESTILEDVIGPFAKFLGLWILCMVNHLLVFLFHTDHEASCLNLTHCSSSLLRLFKLLNSVLVDFLAFDRLGVDRDLTDAFSML